MVKKLKEKLKKIMIQGGFAVIIAVVAMSLYLTALFFANKYFEKSTQPASVAINENGEIYLKGFEKEKDEKIYIMWETDAGSIEPVNENDIFKAQQENKNNKRYAVNTNYNEAIRWSCKDADGYNYEAATIRAIVYSFDEAVNKDVYYMGTYVNEYRITVEMDGEKIKKTDARYFGNPVRAESGADWNQIYILEEKEETITYRYRTGNKIDDENIVLCFESDNNILSETDYEKGMYYCEIKKDNSNKESLYGVTNITVSKKDINASLNEGKDSIYIEAFLVSEKVYNSAVKGTKINDESKHNKAVIYIPAED